MEQTDVRLRAAKDDLADAVAWVARSLPTRPTQPILRGMVFVAGDEGLEIAGYDYEVSTQIRIAAEISETGRFAVNGKLVSDIVSKLPNKPIDMHYDGTKVLVTCGKSRFELPAMTLEDYPALPSVPAATGTIDPQLFTEAIGQVAVAAGRDETLPMLTGIRMETEGNMVTMAATDRFRLAVRTFEWNQIPEGNAELLIPAKTLADTARSLDAGSSEPVTLAFGDGSDGRAVGADGLLGILADPRRTTTRLLDAEFPKFRPLLPKQHSSLASVRIDPLREAIRRVSLVADRGAQIRMDFSEGQVVLSAHGDEAGRAEEVLECAFVGEPLLIAFNPGYLSDGLSAIHTDRVVMGFTQPSRPAVLIPEPDELPEAGEDGMFPNPETEFTYLLMPVRLPG
ncbi:DNA polymerase III subunit beta [Corynebacterium xerosis]|uniref:Beta sliding clamp n=1 Tax=Corynebacterium xerosis TaxID=1725 RepID=A0A0M2XMD1_9CORY|nr:DNA polymerase III subunit beta [Corynebacterium xerosis]SQB96195.1 DNA polymerase III subunit beta [Clostridium paraputrificum]KKO81547.1 DNA polymerase III subunit beta [Corynebacterium xerosis]NMF08784.1 DNA polymerase III subunit beta [Corynebacterium xerosis]PMC61770.1 DNA polymerase III subunit beta [Corynebacterium xerosis]HJG57471.1 DNA polymerase III subunit beta [Corynebacterium xerosis]